jgi:hypothetical protein
LRVLILRTLSVMVSYTGDFISFDFLIASRNSVSQYHNVIEVMNFPNVSQRVWYMNTPALIICLVHARPKSYLYHEGNASELLEPRKFHCYSI